MANILDKYGIKEVADVMFYEINDDGSAGAPVLYLDTLKVSTIEQTGEEATANGGKGNPPLISWDYGKEINVTLEDALFSAKSMAVMFGDSNLTLDTSVKKTVAFVASATDSFEAVAPSVFEGPQGKTYAIPSSGVSYYNADGTVASTAIGGQKYFAVFDLNVSDGFTIDISADTFPGTYYVTGDTYARAERNGKDEFFQFVIPKAKVTSENTITMEADGDPSVFNLNLKVLRPVNGGAMMKLIKYDLSAVTPAQG